MPTAKQFAALRYMIFNSTDGTELSRQILAFLIDQSKGLTKEVVLTLVAGREGYSALEINQAAYGVERMESCRCSTHTGELFKLMGSEFSFSVHYGGYDPSRAGDPFSSDGLLKRPSELRRLGATPEVSPRYTFWLSRDQYSRKAKLVVANREVLERINLKKPGLYPSTEPA